MAIVKFNDIGEFLAELRLDAGEVQRKILRVTNRWRRVDTYPIQSLSVVATYVTEVDGQLVFLESQCGEFMPDSAEAQRVRDTAEKRRASVEAFASGLGLEVRAGVFE